MRRTHKVAVFLVWLFMVVGMSIVPAAPQNQQPDCDTTVRQQDSTGDPGTLQRVIENVSDQPTANNPLGDGEIVVCLEPGLHFVNGLVLINRDSLFPRFTLRGEGGRATIDILPNPGGQLGALVQIVQGTITLQNLTIQSEFREQAPRPALSAIRINTFGLSRSTSAIVTLQNVETHGRLLGVEASGEPQNETSLTIRDSTIRPGIELNGEFSTVEITNTSIRGGLKFAGNFSKITLTNNQVRDSDPAILLDGVTATNFITIQNHSVLTAEGGALVGGVGGAIHIRNSSGTIGILNNTIAGPGGDPAGIFLDRLQGGTFLIRGNTIQGFGQGQPGLGNVDAIRIRWGEPLANQSLAVAIRDNEITANGGCGVHVVNPEQKPTQALLSGLANTIFANCVSSGCKSRFGSNDTQGNLCPNSQAFGRGFGGGFVRVADIQLQIQSGSQVRATVTITDGANNPVKDARVVGVWTLNGRTLGVVSGSTNALGKAQFGSEPLSGRAGDIVQFCVLQISHELLVRNSAADAKRCEQLALP